MRSTSSRRWRSPGRDPREDLPPPIFKKGILKLEDLQPGMELKGTVLNVVDFGAFVDIGLKDSGLVHISQMANRYIKSPYDVVAVGDVVSVWVLARGQGQRHRVSLTMIPPGTERRPPEQRQPRGETRPAGERPPRQDGPPREQQGDRPPPRGDRPAGDRPQPRGDRPAGDRPPPRGRPPMPVKPRSTLPPRGVSRIGTAAAQKGQRKPGEQPTEAELTAEAQAAAETAKPKKQPKKGGSKLSAEALSGKGSLSSFGELAALLAAQEQKPAEQPKAEEPKPEG